MTGDGSTERVYALITGGSAGIGKGIAAALASRGYNLLLVALPDDALPAAAVSIQSEFNVEVHTFGIDLGREGSDLEVFNWVQGGGFRIGILVNNAGFGHLGGFTSFSRDFYHTMLQVNVVNLVGLTRLIIPLIQREGAGYILNVGSAASFIPIPYKTVYASSKGLVYAFSAALREELRGSGLRVSLLCPGAVATNPAVLARIAQAGMLARISVFSPQRIGELAVRQMLKGKWLILPGVTVQAGYYLHKLLPFRIKQRMLARKFRVEEGDQI